MDLSDSDDPSKKLKCPAGADVTLRKTVAEAAAAKLEELPKAYQLNEDTGTWTELEDDVDPHHHFRATVVDGNRSMRRACYPGKHKCD